MTPEIRKTVNQYASEYGSFIGLTWIAIFLCYAEGISSNNMALTAACIIPAIISFILPFMLSLRINKKLFAIGERMTYWRAFSFSLMMFTFASLMSGVATYVYLQYINGGRLLERLASMLADPNVALAYRQMGMGSQHKEIMSMIGQLTPWDFSLSMFSNGMMIGIAASLFLAFFSSFDLNRVDKELR